MHFISALFLAAVLVSAPAQAADEVFIPLGSEGVIVVVDPARDAIVRRIEGLEAVHGLAATPDGAFLVAGSYIDRPSTEAPPPKPQGISEDEHAAHHARIPAAGAPPSVVSTVSVIRVDDGTIVRRIDVPGAVHHVAVDPDGRVAVVTQPDQGTLTAIDLETSQILSTLHTGTQPNYAAFSRDGGRVFISNAGDGTVSEVDTARWIVRRNMIVGAAPEHVVVSRDGDTLFVNNVDEGTVSVIDVATGDVVQTIAVGNVLHGIDVSEDGATLFVAALGDDKVVARELDGDGVREVALAPSPYHVAVIGGTGKVYVSSAEAPKIWVIDGCTLRVVGEIPIGGKGHQIVHVAR